MKEIDWITELELENNTLRNYIARKIRFIKMAKQSKFCSELDFKMGNHDFHAKGKNRVTLRRSNPVR